MEDNEMERNDKGVILFHAGQPRKSTVEVIAKSNGMNVAELLRRWIDEKIDEEVERRR